MKAEVRRRKLIDATAIAFLAVLILWHLVLIIVLLASTTWTNHAVDRPKIIESIEKLTSAIEHVVTIGALIVGGIWAYYKFFKSRTFVPRLVFPIRGSVLPMGKGRIVVAAFKIKNVGLSQVKFRKESDLARVLGFTQEPKDKIKKIEWKLLRAYNVFERHSWIEPGETITDEIAITLPTDEHGGFLIELRTVGGVPNRKDTVLRFQEWLERAVLPANVRDLPKSLNNTYEEHDDE